MRIRDLLRCAVTLVMACLAAAGAHARVELGAPAGQADITIGCLYPLAGRAAMVSR